MMMMMTVVCCELHVSYIIFKIATVNYHRACCLRTSTYVNYVLSTFTYILQLENIFPFTDKSFLFLYS